MGSGKKKMILNLDIKYHTFIFLIYLNFCHIWNDDQGIWILYIGAIKCYNDYG
jgi:hypothetical protein